METARAREPGKVAIPPKEVPQEDIVGQLKPIVRRATPVDLADAQYNASREEQALQKCREKVAEYGLPIKVICADGTEFHDATVGYYLPSEQAMTHTVLVEIPSSKTATAVEIERVDVNIVNSSDSSTVCIASQVE